MSKKIWSIIFAYRLPKLDRKVFLQDLSNILSQIVNKYETILIVADVNIDLYESKCKTNIYFSELKETFHLTNLIKNLTLFKAQRGTLLDVSKTYN